MNRNRHSPCFYTKSSSSSSSHLSVPAHFFKQIRGKPRKPVQRRPIPSYNKPSTSSSAITTTNIKRQTVLTHTLATDRPYIILLNWPLAVSRISTAECNVWPGRQMSPDFISFISISTPTNWETNKVSLTSHHQLQFPSQESVMLK